MNPADRFQDGRTAFSDRCDSCESVVARVTWTKTTMERERVVGNHRFDSNLSVKFFSPAILKFVFLRMGRKYDGSRWFASSEIKRSLKKEINSTESMRVHNGVYKVCNNFLLVRTVYVQ